MTERIKSLIEQLVSSTLQEVLRGFNLNKFKNLEDLEEMHRYAAEHLPHMGTGSSRTVYALSSSKVLKIAGQWEPDFDIVGPSTANRGLAQNKQEVNSITHSESLKELAAISDFADDYSWVIAEIVKPFKDAEEFSQETGIDFYLFEDFLAWYNNTGNVKETIEELGAQIWHNWIDWNDDIPGVPVSSKEDILEHLKNEVATHPVVRASMALFDQGGATGDIAEPDHWGKNAAGEIRLIDYGITPELHRKYYQ